MFSIVTDLRYLDDSTVRTFEATVERSLDERVVLDATHFYPTGGGQPHDTGVIETDDSTWRVIDVEKKDTVYHTLEPTATTADPTPEEDTVVTGHLDWDRRYAHMRYHTAQHLLSALLLEEFDAQTTGNQLYSDHAHLDAAYDRFSAADLDFVERRLNEFVEADRPVTWDEMDRQEAEETLDTDRTRIDLLPDSITELRIVEIAGKEAEESAPYDRTACAGTHVGSTGEIGEIVVTGRETKGREQERVQFVLADHIDSADGESAERE